MTNEANAPDQPRRPDFWWLLLLAGAIVAVAVAWFQQWPAPIVARDLNQHRANVAAAMPDGDLILEQRFTPYHDGLSDLELIFHRNVIAADDDDGTLVMTLLDADAQSVTSQQLATRDLTHNQVYKLEFEPQLNSAETTYTLQISGQNNQSITLWGYELDALSDGILLTSDPTQATAAQDLRLVTHYTLTPTVALRTTISELGDTTVIAIATLLFLYMPGFLLWQTLFRKRPPPDFLANGVVRVAVILTTGTAMWPIIWLWVTIVGGNFGRISLLLLLIIGYITALTLKYTNRSPNHPVSQSPSLPISLLFFATYLTRLLAARDLTFPAWVDSSRHALMTAVMADSGQFLRNYQPYLDASQSVYHYGYHTISASLVILRAGAMPDVLHVTGQLINALIPVAIYATAWMITRRHSAGLIAAFLVAFPFFFPGYYVSWGRLTQLTGMLVLTILLAFTWQLTIAHSQGRDSASSSSFRLHPSSFILPLLASGLFLIHFRVFLVYLPLAGLLWLISLRRAPWQLPLMGLLCGLIVVPRAIELFTSSRPGRVFTTGGTYNNFPTGYVTTGWETWLLVAAAGGVALALVYLISRYRWLGWLLAACLLGTIAAGEWLATLPPLFDIRFVRWGLASLLFFLNLYGWQHDKMQWTLPPMIWLAVEHLVLEEWQSPALFVALCLITFLAPRLGRISDESVLDERNFVSGWAKAVLLLGLWVGLLFGLLVGERVGLPQSWVLNLNAMYITLFLPISLAMGITASAIWHWLQRQHWGVKGLTYPLIGALLMVLLLFGTREQVDILNPATVLAEQPDRPALDWVAANTPSDARFATSSWLWLGGTWAAQDGGAWLLPYVQRASTIPPADYTYSRPLGEQVSGFNVSAEKITDWSTDEAINLLRSDNVTHVYVGARGGFIKPDQLNRHPDTTLIYEEDGVFIFSLTP